MKKILYVMLAAVMLNAAGCSNTGASDVAAESTSETKNEIKADISEIHETVKAAYGDEYIPSMEYDAELFSEKFGITENLYESYIAEGPMISVHVDEFVAVQAKEGQGEKVEELLNAYREMLLNDSLQYPMNLTKIEASEVIRHGDYVFFVMLGTPDAEAEVQGEEAALKSAVEKNKIAVNLINGSFTEG